MNPSRGRVSVGVVTLLPLESSLTRVDGVLSSIPHLIPSPTVSDTDEPFSVTGPTRPTRGEGTKPPRLRQKDSGPSVTPPKTRITVEPSTPSRTVTPSGVDVRPTLLTRVGRRTRPVRSGPSMDTTSKGPTTTRGRPVILRVTGHL